MRRGRKGRRRGETGVNKRKERILEKRGREEGGRDHEAKREKDAMGHVRWTASLCCRQEDVALRRSIEIENILSAAFPEP